MKNMVEIYALLKQYGTFIYTGDRIGDLELMEDEIRELYQGGMVDAKQFQHAILLLRSEKQRLLQEKY
jgi:uncharacterized protein YqgQ